MTFYLIVLYFILFCNAQKQKHFPIVKWNKELCLTYIRTQQFFICVGCSTQQFVSVGWRNSIYKVGAWLFLTLWFTSIKPKVYIGIWLLYARAFLVVRDLQILAGSRKPLRSIYSTCEWEYVNNNLRAIIPASHDLIAL